MSLSDRQMQILRVCSRASVPLSDADIAEGCAFERWEKYRVTYAVSLLVDAGLLTQVGTSPVTAIEYPGPTFGITEAGRAVVLEDRVMK